MGWKWSGEMPYIWSSQGRLPGGGDILVETVGGSVSLAKSYLFHVYLFIWLCRVLIAACRIFIVAVGSRVLPRNRTPGPLHWKLRVLTTGPPGKSLAKGFWENVPDSRNSKCKGPEAGPSMTF